MTCASVSRMPRMLTRFTLNSVASGSRSSRADAIRPSADGAGSFRCSSGVGSRSSISPVAISTMCVARWFGRADAWGATSCSLFLFGLYGICTSDASPWIDLGRRGVCLRGLQGSLISFFGLLPPHLVRAGWFLICILGIGWHGAKNN